MIEEKEKNEKNMKYTIIIAFILFITTNLSVSDEKKDCTEFKKYSMKYAWCKSKNVGNSLKTKIGKNKETKN